MIRISQVKIGIDEDEALIKERICRKLQIPSNLLISYEIVRKSVDARKEFVYSYIVDCFVKEEKALERRNKKPRDIVFVKERIRTLVYKKQYRKGRVAIIGFGPTGLFSAYALSQSGFKVDVYERGEDVDSRTIKVNSFWEGNEFDEKSNAVFGEGGAGTFSDGKLTARNKDEKGRFILETFVKYGADKAILYEAYPHIGSDVLGSVVKNMREGMIEYGAQVHFNSMVDDLRINDGKVEAIHVNDEWLEYEYVILAIGHSATDTFRMLKQHDIELCAKDFALGVRIEHPQSLINKAQYKQFASHPKCPTAIYQLSGKTQDNRGVYTFCMCPGGQVIHASNQPNTICVNGMSNYKRDNVNANSALLVQVHTSDFNNDCWEGIKLVDELEHQAYALSNSYKAPTQLVKDFLNNKASTKAGSIKSTYSLGNHYCNLNDLLPTYISSGLKDGLLAMDKKLKGFKSDDALLVGVETRSSSPLRINRNPITLSATTVSNLFPGGEGAGYAGGIVSSASDGLRICEQILAHSQEF